MAVVFTLRGLQKKTLKVGEHSIVIEKGDSLFGTGRRKIIPLESITGIEVKAPGLVSGYIQLQMPGMLSSNSQVGATGGAWEAATDENSIMFATQALYKKALEIQDYILAFNREQLSSRNSSHSVTNVVPKSAAEEIKEFKALLDDGVISQEEFDAKKKQLLNI